eukprot:5175357-Pyramimonas_sp.AAC.1
MELAARVREWEERPVGRCRIGTVAERRMRMRRRHHPPPPPPPPHRPHHHHPHHPIINVTTPSPSAREPYPATISRGSHVTYW